MKYSTLLIGLISAIATSGLALPDEQADLRAKLDKKLAKEFVQSGGWVLDYDEARATAAKEKKILFVYFTRTFAP